MAVNNTQNGSRPAAQTPDAIRAYRAQIDAGTAPHTQQQVIDYMTTYHRIRNENPPLAMRVRASTEWKEYTTAGLAYSPYIDGRTDIGNLPQDYQVKIQNAYDSAMTQHEDARQRVSPLRLNVTAYNPENPVEDGHFTQNEGDSPDKPSYGPVNTQANQTTAPTVSAQQTATASPSPVTQASGPTQDKDEAQASEIQTATASPVNTARAKKPKDITAVMMAAANAAPSKPQTAQSSGIQTASTSSTPDTVTAKAPDTIATKTATAKNAAPSDATTTDQVVAQTLAATEPQSAKTTKVENGSTPAPATASPSVAMNAAASGTTEVRAKQLNTPEPKTNYVSTGQSDISNLGDSDWRTLNGTNLAGFGQEIACMLRKKDEDWNTHNKPGKGFADVGPEGCDTLLTKRDKSQSDSVAGFSSAVKEYPLPPGVARTPENIVAHNMKIAELQKPEQVAQMKEKYGVSNDFGKDLPQDYYDAIKREKQTMLASDQNIRQKFEGPATGNSIVVPTSATEEAADRKQTAKQELRI